MLTRRIFRIKFSVAAPKFSDPGSAGAPTRCGQYASKFRNICPGHIDGFIPSEAWFPVDPWRVLGPLSQED
jgi:hypothetical protein